MSDITDRQIHSSVLNHLFHIMYDWQSKADYAFKQEREESIRYQVHQQWEGQYKNDYELAYSTPSSESDNKMREWNKQFLDTTAEVKNWKKIIEYTADKFGLEIYKTEKGEDGWRPKAQENKDGQEAK